MVQYDASARFEHDDLEGGAVAVPAHVSDTGSVRPRFLAHVSNW